MKKCPFCVEEIQDEAIVCKHCGRELAPQEVARISETLISAEEISEEPLPEPAVKEELTEQDIPAPDEVDKPQRPIWKSALRVGVLWTLLYVGYKLTHLARLMQIIDPLDAPYQILFEPILWGGLTNFVIGTLLGFILIPLWRWQKWAPFALVALVIAGVVGYESEIIGLQLPNFANQLSNLAQLSSTTQMPTTAQAQPASNVRMPTLKPTPWSGTLLGK